MKSLQRGFTLFELMIVLWAVAVFAVGYVLIHFITKFW